MLWRVFAATALFYTMMTDTAMASIDGMIDEAIKPIADWSLGVVFTTIPVMGEDIPFIILWLMAVGLFCSFYFRFMNLRLFGLSLQLLGGKYQSQQDKEGQISNWQALSTSLSGTVGLGNIAGVAVAISVGGPGATIWMILMGFLGMTTKFVECSLGVKYRRISGSGEVSGGPMYYIRQGFSDRGLPKVGMVLAAFFAICCVGGAFGGGNMFQANQTYQMYLRLAGESSFFSDKGWLFGLGLAVLTGAVILGGITSIAKASEKIFPVMTGIYLLMCLVILGANFSAIPEGVANIFDGMFSTQAVGGGILGALIAGVKRAVFSNESGIGSAPITYAAVRSDSHIAQGIIAMLNPFLDTVVICTMTALVISVTGVYTLNSGIEGIELTARAFATAGEWAIYWLGLSVFLFAYSTLISWYYLGEKAFTYLAGNGRVKVMLFKLAYCSFVIVGCSANLSNVINFTDALFFAMAIPNVIVIYMMAPEIRRDLDAYMASLKLKYNLEKPAFFTTR